MLLHGRLKVVDLPGSQVSRAREVIRTQPRLSIHDGFAFALAEVNHVRILLTGDSLLRSLGGSSQIEVQGLLWALDQPAGRGDLELIETIMHILILSIS
jgi:hypothetical protein